MAVVLGDARYEVMGRLLLKIAHGTRRKSRDGREWFWNEPTKRWRLTDEYKENRKQKKLKKKNSNRRGTLDDYDSKGVAKSIEWANDLLDALDSDDIADQVEGLRSLLSGDRTSTGKAPKKNKRKGLSGDLKKLQDATTGKKMFHLANKEPLDALNNIVGFPVNTQKRLQKLIDDQMQVLKDLGVEASVYIEMSKQKNLIDSLKKELADTDALIEASHRVVRDRLTRIYSERISREDAKIAAMHKRIYELLHPRKLIRVPRGTTQLQYYNIVARLAAEDKAAVKKYTIRKPKGYKNVHDRKYKTRRLDKSMCVLISGVQYQLKGDRLNKASLPKKHKAVEGQASLFGGEWDEQKHDRDSSGRFVSKGKGAVSGAIEKLGAGASKIEAKIATMPIGKLRDDYDVDGDLNDNHMISALLHLEKHMKKGEDETSHGEIEDITDNHDEHFPELSQAYSDHHSRLQSAIDARIADHESKVDDILDEAHSNFHDEAQNIVDSVDSPDAWADAQAKLHETHARHLKGAFAKLKDLGAERDDYDQLMETMREALDDHLEAYEGNEWDDLDDEDLSKCVRIGGVQYQLKGDRLVKVALPKKYKAVEGQGSLFDGEWDEQKHDRDSSGKFTSKGGSAGTHPHQKIGKRLLGDLKARFHESMSKKQAKYHGLDPSHPGIGWDEEMYSEYSQAYRNGGDRAVGLKAIQYMRSDDDGYEAYRNLIAPVMKDLDFSKLHDSIQSHLDGTPKQLGGLEGVLMQHLGSEIDEAQDIIRQGDEADEDEEKEARKLLDTLRSPEAAQKFINRMVHPREERFDLQEDVASYATDNIIDLDHVGSVVSSSMKLDKHDGSDMVVIDWNESEAAKDQKVYHSFDTLSDWDAVADHVKASITGGEGSTPINDPLTQYATDTLISEIDQHPEWKARVAKNLNNPEYDPAHIAKLNFRGIMQPETYSSVPHSFDSSQDIRSKASEVMDTPEAQRILSDRHNHPPFVQKIQRLTSKAIYGNAPRHYAVKGMAEALGVKTNQPGWQSKVGDELVEKFGIERSQLPRMGISESSVLTKIGETYYFLSTSGLKKAAIGSTTTRNGKTYRLNANHRWESIKHHAHAIAHAADHLGESVASWKAGKVIGGAIASIATAAGADPIGAQIMSETAVQAGTAAMLHHIKQQGAGNASARDTAVYFVAQAAAAFAGKVAHHGAEWSLEHSGAGHMYQSLGALISGKGAGIGTVTAAHKTGIAARVVDHVVRQGQHDLRFFEAALTGGLRKAADDPTHRLFFDLTAAAMAMAIAQFKNGNILDGLQKAIKDVPGQMSLFDETKHPRSKSGQFVSAKHIDEISDDLLQQLDKVEEEEFAKILSDNTWRKYGFARNGMSYEKIHELEGKKSADETVKKIANIKAKAKLLNSHNEKVKAEEKAYIEKDAELAIDYETMKLLDPTHPGTLFEYMQSVDKKRFERFRGAKEVDYKEGDRSPFKKNDSLKVFDGDEFYECQYIEQRSVFVDSSGQIDGTSGDVDDNNYEAIGFVFKNQNGGEEVITSIELQENGLYLLGDGTFLHERDDSVNELVLSKGMSKAAITRVLNWNHIPIGIEYEVGDVRHGRKMKAVYGHVRGSYGHGADGEALDVYIGKDLGSQKVFKVRQVVPETGEFDEDKYVIGCHSQNEAKLLYLANMPERFFGGIESVNERELSKYKKH